MAEPDEVIAEAIPGIDDASSSCPGKGEMILVCPCGCSGSAACNVLNDFLIYIIVHLNDDHNWTRERVADWLESLDVDLTFQVKV